MAEKAILFDATKCMGCRACQVACKQWNELEGEVTTNWGSYENPRDLSPQTWLKMEFREIEANGALRWLFLRRSCMHCTNAACVEVCPTKALYYHPLGFVSYDKGKCGGCGYCAQFCPFNVPRLNTNRASGLGRMDKCTLCTIQGLDRIDNDLEPACVKTCPPQALNYDNRDQLITRGKARIEELKAQGYNDATLYGENVVGGTHVLYVLDQSPAQYGLPTDPKVPTASTVWQNVIQPLGYAALGLVGIGLLLNIMVARANMLNERKGR